MSHFAIMVIGDNIDGQLSRYDENLETPERKEGYVSRKDKLDFLSYYTKEEEDKKREVKRLNNKLFDKWYEKYGDGWNGSRWRKDSNGKWCSYTTYNPDSKWDWYVVGGRWEGSLLNKKGQKVNSDTKANLDIQGMRDEGKTEYLKRFDLVESAFGGEIPRIEIFWKDLIEKLSDDFTIEQARDIYGSQEAKMVQKNALENDNLNEDQRNILNGWGFDLENYQCTREEYGEQGYNGALTFYSILKDGVWFSKGDMGWWGMSNDKLTDDEWNVEVSKLIDSCVDETEITIVDCHI